GASDGGPDRHRDHASAFQRAASRPRRCRLRGPDRRARAPPGSGEGEWALSHARARAVPRSVGGSGVTAEAFEPERIDRVFCALQRSGYTIDGAKFPTGRPDRVTVPVLTRTGRAAVAKCYPSDRGELTFANMQALWRSSFGERRQPPGLPQPIDYLPETGTLIMERLAGRPLAERDAADAVSIAESVTLIAALHDCEARPTKKRDRRRIVREITRNLAASAEIAPEYAGVLAPAVEALEASAGAHPPIVPRPPHSS